MPATQEASSAINARLIEVQGVDHHNGVSLRAIAKAARAKAIKEQKGLGPIIGRIASPDVNFTDVSGLEVGQRMVAFVVQEGRFKAPKLVTQLQEDSGNRYDEVPLASTSGVFGEIRYAHPTSGELIDAVRLGIDDREIQAAHVAKYLNRIDGRIEPEFLPAAAIF